MTNLQAEFEEECRVRGIDVPIALAVRTALAKAIDIAPNDLRFETPTTTIISNADRAHWDGWDDMYFIFAFEEITGLVVPSDMHLPRIAPGRLFFWKWPGAATFGEWCQKVVPALKVATAKRQDLENV